MFKDSTNPASLFAKPQEASFFHLPQQSVMKTN